MANFDRATYSLLLFRSGTATNTAVAVPDVDLAGKVTTIDDLSLGGTATELVADDLILGGRGIVWSYVLNGQISITGNSLSQFIGSSNADVIDLTGPNGFDGYSSSFLTIEGGLGSDVIWGGGAGTTVSFLIGDLADVTGVAGGSDDIVGGGSTDTILGDFLTASGSSTGGADTLRAAGGTGDAVIGDASIITGGNFTGGDDDILGDDTANELTGDIANFQLTGAAQATGGADDIRGGGGADVITGDFLKAEDVEGAADALDLVGGDDDLFGDAGDDEIYGDAQTFATASGGFQGGDDTINGGAGDDSLWGDIGTDTSTVTVTGGADTFVFDGTFGDDIIFDFVTGEDTIDLSALGVTQSDLDDSNPIGTVNNADTRAQVSGGDLVITPTGNAADGTITVDGVTSLVVSDFTFA